jgi:peptidoglycan/xylan/chitin deacetylase (PgdA/CDA1 family)
VDSPEVRKWVSEINWDLVPGHPRTKGDCGTPEAEGPDGRCWWTCRGCTRATDITECPDKLTWGLSFDDGPSEFTPMLLEYLNRAKLTTTWFVVGSRVVSRPDIVVAEYMSGHQLSLHSWSHAALTSLSNEQVVAELGWTAKAIKDVVGVTPNTFRPPYGDIDDRVRAIALQMGFTPVMWSAYEDVAFDTDDWNIPGGGATGQSSFTHFQRILEEYAPRLDAGFIVLEHDLYQQTVDLAVGYFLPLAMQSKYLLRSVIDCLHRPLSEAYIETFANRTITPIPISSAAAAQPSVAPPATTPASSAVGPLDYAPVEDPGNNIANNAALKNAAVGVGASSAVVGVALLAALALK